MKVRKFFAPTSREALRLVREALGADAVVLSNRVVEGGVELVALTEENLTDWVDDGGNTPMLNGALPSWDQAFSNEAHTDHVGHNHAAAHPVEPTLRASTAPSAARMAAPSATQSAWRDALPRKQSAALPDAMPARGPLATKGAASSPSVPSPFPWRDAPPRSAISQSTRAEGRPSARPLSSGNASSTARRDRTVALPGVLAAGEIEEDGVSALAYKHRGLRGDDAVGASSAKSAAPYNSASMYADSANGFADAPVAEPSAGAYAQHADQPAAQEEDADVVWKPSGRVSANATAPHDTITRGPARSSASAGERASGQSTAAISVSGAASTFVPFTAASVRTADVPTLPSESSVPAPEASATPVTHADQAAASMKTNESKRSATRSIFARIFSRQSSAERANAAAASESAATALSRLEKHDESASVLGLQRAERRDDVDTSEASAGASRRDGPLSASSATARGMGTVSAPIEVRPAATHDDTLPEQQPASATLPQEARAMYESETYPQQDAVQYSAPADNAGYAPMQEQFAPPSYPEGFSPEDFDVAIAAARKADAEAAAGMNSMTFVDQAPLPQVQDLTYGVQAAEAAAFSAAVSADVRADINVENKAEVKASVAPQTEAVELVAAAAVSTMASSDAPAPAAPVFVEQPQRVAEQVATKPNGMSFAPAHYNAQTRLKGMSSGQSTGHGVPFLHVSPNTQAAVHAPALAVAASDLAVSVSPTASVNDAAVDSAVDSADDVPAVTQAATQAVAQAVPQAEPPVYTADNVPAIDLGEVSEAIAPAHTVETANLMETAGNGNPSESRPTSISEAPLPSAASTEAPPASPSPSEATHPRIIAGKVLSEMRTLCGTLGEQLDALESQSAIRPDPTRVAMTRMLLGCGFSAQLVRLLLARMPVVADPEQGLAWVKATFERNLPVLDNEDALMEQGGVFALMGPTGVGKTTTTAKLAARAVMRHGADRVALLTTDSYRIGAHEQLRIYGRILGVAVHAVKDAADLSLVLSELRNKHMVLIDTIGMSQRDRAVSEQVSMLCGSHLPVKRLLLLNATSHGDTLNEVVRAYGTRDASNGAASGLSGCIITKVDESHGIGAALDTVMRHRLPVHYVSNGQKVPEDLRVARRGFLIDNAFSERHRTSPFQPDEEDLSMIFGGDEQAASMLSSGSMAQAVANVAHASEAHYG